MGRSTAEDVLQTFLAGISDLDQSKILQVASDGPNVNLLFLKNLAESREEKELLPLLDIGRCGFTLSIIVLKRAKKEAIQNFKNCQRLCGSFSRKLEHVGLCMKMYQSLWTIPCSFEGIVGARMRKVLKEQKLVWRVIANLLLILVA